MPEVITPVPDELKSGGEYIKERYKDWPPEYFGSVTREQLLPKRYLARGEESDGIAIVSGGLDSVTMVHLLVAGGRKPHLLSFDYGQRHKRELTYALEAAERLGLRWSLIDLTSITELIGSSALTSYAASTGSIGSKDPQVIEVPRGHYAEDNMAITVVPNRNMTMLSIAAAVAVSNKYEYVAAGMHAGDHAQYPDCREEFLISMRGTLMIANEGFINPNFVIMAPWLYVSKNDIAQEAYRLDVQPAWTYSCYNGQPNHCGLCATCTERLEAIDSVKQAPDDWDQTVYDDNTTWAKVVADWNANH
jgi:7-cyano-7-deazaguanine synthase